MSDVVLGGGVTVLTQEEFYSPSNVPALTRGWISLMLYISYLITDSPANMLRKYDLSYINKTANCSTVPQNNKNYEYEMYTNFIAS